MDTVGEGYCTQLLVSFSQGSYTCSVEQKKLEVLCKAKPPFGQVKKIKGAKIMAKNSFIFIKRSTYFITIYKP